MTAQITCERLRELLAYDAETGVFTRLVRTAGCVKVGDVAGSKGGNGYIQICVLGRRRYAHRLAWLYFYGEWPAGEIDHIDGNPINNAIANLRDVSSLVNSQNLHKAPSNSTHGFIGAARNGTRWMARIRVDGKTRYIGQFDTPAEASIAYINAKRQFHEGNML